MNGSEINMYTIWWDIPRSVMMLSFTDVIDIKWNRVTM